MAVTTVNRDYQKAFRVDETFFKRVEKLAADAGTVFLVTIWLSDSSNIEGLSVASLIVFDNLSSRQIIRV